MSKHGSPHKKKDGSRNEYRKTDNKRFKDKKRVKNIEKEFFIRPDHYVV